MSLFRNEAIAARAQRLAGEVLLRQPLRYSVLTIAFVSITAGAALWAATSRYYRTERVPGVVVSAVPASKVFAPRPGVVVGLAGGEGSHVRAGDVLATIRVDSSEAYDGSPSNARLSALASQALIADHSMELARKKTASEQGRLQSSLHGLQAESRQLLEQIALQNEVVASAREMFEQVQGVVEKGYITRLEFERRRQSYLTEQQRLSSLNQQLAASQSRQAEVKAQLAQLTIDLDQSLSETRSSIQSIAESRARILTERGYEITAPITGRVTAVQAKPGQFVDPRRPILTLVPEAATYEVELYAPSRAVGFARPGQPVAVLFDAFPYQRFGNARGYIRWVSRSIVRPDEADAPIELKEPVYRLRVRLERQTVTAYGQEHPLQHGMTLVANIQLEDRSLLEWLYEPVRAVRNRV